MGRKIEPPKVGHIVKEWYDGNTHCIICDDYCRDLTPEEKERRRERVSEVAYELLYRQEMKRRKEAAATGS